MVLNSTNINRLIYLLFIVALGVAVYSVRDRLNELCFPTKPQYGFLLVAIVGQVLFWLIACFSWLQSLRILIGYKLPFISGYIHSNMVTIGKYLPGKIWGLVSRGVNLKQRGFDTQKTILVSYIDQVLLLHAGVIVGFVSIALSKSLALAAIVFVVGGLSVLFMPKSQGGLVVIMAKFINNVDAKKLKDILTVRNYSILVFYYMAVWSIAGVIFSSLYFTFFGFEFKLLLPLIGANAIGIVAGFVAFFAPGGLGVREGVSAGILVEFIPLEEAAFLVLAYRLWTVITDIVGGVTAFGLFYFRIEGRSLEKPES